MTTETERANIARIQDSLNEIKAIANIEIKGNTVSGDAAHLNAWTEVLGRTQVFHSKLTRIGLKHFPEFFDEVVIKGGGHR